MAAAAHAENGQNPPPPELALARQCRMFNALPYAGGVLAQPAGVLERMRAAWNAYTAWGAYVRDGQQPGAMAAWAQANPELDRVAGMVKRLRQIQAKG